MAPKPKGAFERRTLRKSRGGAKPVTPRERQATASAGTHSVYVILLDAEARRVVRRKPPRTESPALPCVYVGMTGLPPYERFENHKAGVKAARVVQRFGLKLMPELYEHLNPMPFEAAAQMERDLAEDLRRSGYTVFGGK